jgi:hypothetical protein
MMTRGYQTPMACLAASALLLLSSGFAVGPKATRLEGEYHIVSAGQEIGVEKYVLETSADGVKSMSQLDLHNPGTGPKKASLETRLEMDAQYVPRDYELKSEIDGEKGTIRGSFAPNQVIFEYSGKGASFRNGLLLGNRYTILDTNVFHHFIFLARLFKYNEGKTPQTFEVLIPQEKDTGKVSIAELQKETILIKGKKASVSHLLLDSGSIQIHLWVDGERIPRKISVPGKGIEVLHGD